MHTLKRIPDTKKNASGKDYKSYISSLCTKSTIKSLNSFIDLHSRHGVLFPSQRRVASMSGVVRKTVNRAVSRLGDIGVMTHKRRYNSTAIYTLSQNIFKFKDDLLELLPALKKCLTVRDLTICFKNVPSILKEKLFLNSGQLSSVKETVSVPMIVNEDTRERTRVEIQRPPPPIIVDDNDNSWFATVARQVRDYRSLAKRDLP